MIPADLAARLRLINEASFFNTEPPVAGLQRAREIQAQLPELVPGQRFFATLQRTLPDGTFRALVAGQQMTLSLNSAAEVGRHAGAGGVAGDAARGVRAHRRRRDGGRQHRLGAAGAEPDRAPDQLVLLTGQPTPQPASLAGNQPLLNAPPTNGTQLVPLLRQALGQRAVLLIAPDAVGRRQARHRRAAREPQGQQSAPGAGAGQPGRALRQTPAVQAAATTASATPSTPAASTAQSAATATHRRRRRRGCAG